MTNYSAGTAYLTVVPSFRGIEQAMQDQVRKMAEKVDKSVAAALPKGMAEGARQARGTGERAGDTFGGEFERAAKKRLTAAYRALPKPAPDVDLHEWDRALVKVRADIRQLSRQRIGVDIDENTFTTAVEHMRQRLRSLMTTAPELNTRGWFNANEAEEQLGQLSEFVAEARRRGDESGDAFGGAFTTRMAAVLERGIKAIPRIEIDADSSEAERRLHAVREQMASLAAKTIGVDIDAAAAFAELKLIEAELRHLDRLSVQVDVRTNAHDAVAGMSELIKQAEQAADEAGGAFKDRMAKVLQQGLTAIPPVKIDADSSEAERRLHAVREQMASLAAKTIGVDIDAAAAFAELKLIEAELRHLDRLSVQVDVRTNAHDAAAGMSELIAQAEHAARSTEKTGHAANFSMTRLGYLIAVGASLGSAIVPAALAAAAAVGAIGTAGIAGAAGLGVFTLGVSGVADAVQALNQARGQVAGSTAQARMAELSLAYTRRSIADAEYEAALRVRDAQQGLADARRQAARDAVDAAQAVRDAQREVTRAEQDAREVRRALNEAIRDAARDLAALDVALGRNNLEQDKATTAQMEALEALNRLRDNPRATEVELRRATEAYDEQTQRLVELRQQHKELAEDRERANRLGVEGDERVIAARARVAEADERAALARERLERAQSSQREQEYQSVRRVAQAQRQVADAMRAQARQQRDAQYQLAQTAASSSSALDKLHEEMSQLSPAGQRFARFLFGLKDEVLALRSAAAEPLLPGLQAAMTVLLPYLPAVARFVGAVAGQLANMAVQAAQTFGAPVWQRFFRFVDATAVPSLQTLYEIGANTTEGLAALFLALTPFNAMVGRGLVELSEGFTRWAQELNRTQGYREFLAYVSENGPRVIDLLDETGELLVDLVKAAMPLGSVVLRAVTGLVDVLNGIPTWALTVLVGTIAAVSFGIMGLGAVMRAVKFRQQLIDIFGPPVARMVNTYAIETGRATEKTSVFGKAVATASGMTAVATTRMGALAATAGGPLLRGVDAARMAAFNAALALNGPAGVAGAAQTAGHRMAVLGAAANAAAAGGLTRARLAAFEVAVAANGPGGLAAGATAAAGKVKALGTTAASAASSIGAKMLTGMGSAVAFLGGPWGLALAGAGLAAAMFAAESAKQQAKVDSLTSALAALAGEYRDLAVVGKQASREAENTFANIVKNNPDMQEAVVTLDRMGVSLDDVVKAATSGDPAKVLQAIDAELKKIEKDYEGTALVGGASANEQHKKLTALREALVKNADAVKLQKDAMEVLNKSDERSIFLQQVKTTQARAGTAAQQALISEYDRNAASIDALTTLTKAFGDAQATGATRADAMRAAIEAQTGSVTAAIEQDELFAQKLIGLRDQVNGAKVAHDRHATSLALNSATALRNRDALEDVATAVRDMYLEDLAAGKPLDEVTRRHHNRINALREEARRLGLAKTETDRLIKTYGEVDPKLETVYTTKGFETVYKELARLKFIQDALAKGWSVEKAKAVWEAQQWWNKGFAGPVKIPERAQGGPIVGPGTATSDDVLMWGSDGEFMQPAASVRYYGPEFMEAIRTRSIPRAELPGYADGGPVTKRRPPAHGGPLKFPMVTNVTGTHVPTLDEVIAASGGLGTAGGGRGWRWQIAVLRAAFPGLALYSGYRANSYTASGGLSWHSRDGGRAVDVPPRAEVFRFIHDRYGKNTKELIWGGDPNENIWMGRHYRFDDALLYQHGPYRGVRGPSPHVHWAFDDGGLMPPGWNLMPNFTGQPEPVLSPGQWRTIEEFVAQGMAAGGGDTYNFEFANTTLDQARLATIQQRADALNRANRPNR